MCLAKIVVHRSCKRMQDSPVKKEKKKGKEKEKEKEKEKGQKRNQLIFITLVSHAQGFGQSLFIFSSVFSL